MQAVELLFAIEEAFGVALPDESLNETTFDTAGSLWQAVRVALDEGKADMREPPEYAAVAEHFERLYRPAFGRPHSIADLQVLADGSRVVVTGSVFEELAGSARTAIYTVDAAELTSVTAGAGSAHGARFSPDGTVLAFLSDRANAGKFQLFLLAGHRFGEAVPAPQVAGSVEFAHWSPDGRHILLGVAGLGAELSGGQGSGTNTSPQADLPAWHPVVEGGVDEEAWRSLWLFSVAADTLSRLSPQGLNCWEAGWCGPGHVVAVTSAAPDEGSWYDAVLTLIDTGTGATRELLRSDVQLGLPAGAPDGAHACVVEAVCSDRGLVAGDLIVLDMAAGTRETADTAGTDVSQAQWIDGTRLGYAGQRHLDSVAGILDIGSGHRTEVVSTPLACGGGWYPGGAFTADGRFATIEEAYSLPQQIVLTGGDPGGEDKKQVLASTAHAGTGYLLSIAGPAQPVRWRAPDGLEIEGILCTPPGDGPFPLVVNIHGGPVSAYRNTWSLGYHFVPLLVSRGYAVLSPNPRGSGGRGRAFAQQVVGDMGGADTYDLLSGIDALTASGVADASRVGLIGGSYGGYMSCWLVTQDQRFAAAVPIAPVTDWYSQSFTSNIGNWGNVFMDADPEQPGSRVHTRSPVLQASKVRTPCLIIGGGEDRCTPPSQAREFHQALLSHGVESVLAIYPQEGHGVRSYPAVIDLMARIVHWFGKHMPPGVAS